ncbi:hypothetical protein LTR05_003770 [Lithohypha guttulata]|uniref:Major facilitator superfamily (MFS) profile domain-containing protein n=1 Tax=Lithohypha guttulata TaxID=1690604 RepID=A0AAN7T0A4_9EURO|nr:hypothetical protein LTR05_003770 [Lithohypha guttulata]
MSIASNQSPVLINHTQAKEFREVHFTENDVEPGSNHNVDKSHGNAPNNDSIDTNFQAGVQKAEAVTISWTKTTLIVAYIGIWLVYFCQGIITGITGALVPYVTSAFAEHSLIPTTGILSQVIGGVTNLGVAKILDIFGRPHGFLLCASSCTIGLIMSATCNNVEAYAASQVFYTIGINGMGYILSVFIADTTSLRHRGLVQALCNSPYLITSWIAGPISTSFLNGAGWRWAFGMGSILLPSVTLPLFGLFMLQYMKAKKKGIMTSQGQRKRSPWESAMYYIHEFDVIGLLLICAGFAFFLLPFSLYTQQAKGWRSALIVCFLVFGIILVGGFILWERFFARVVNNLSVTRASYLVQGGIIAQIGMNIVAGSIISVTGRYKPVSLYFGFPIIVLGTGLMIHFRQPDQHVGCIAMSYLFVNFGFGILMLTLEISILAAASAQQYFAIAIALLNLFAYIGGAVGYTISSAIWQAMMPKKLALYLPPEAQESLVMIYADVTQQLSYEVGSPTRSAIQRSYGDTWRLLLIAAVSTWAVAFVAILVWKDMNVKDVKQNKGRVV